MKHTRRFLAMLLALVLTLGLCVTAFAEDGDTTATVETGTITIIRANGDTTKKAVTYHLYKIFDIESYDTGKNAYAYKIADHWTNFFAEGGDGHNYIEHMENADYVTWTAGNKAEVLQTFAKLAIQYARDPANGVQDAGTITIPEGQDSSQPLDKLDLGYYLLDSTLGSLCALTPLTPNAEVKEKNGYPTIQKEVVEGNTPGKTNDAAVGDTVTFQVTVTVTAGVENYTVHDKMDAGLKFSRIVSVEKTSNNKTRELAYGEGYTLTPNVTHTDKDGKQTTDTFDLELVDTAIDVDDTIVITYEATITAAAVQDTDGLTNEAVLEYGDSNRTTPAQTKTYTWELNVYKFTTNNNGGETKLANAKFVLYKVKTVEGKEVKSYASFKDGIFDGWVDTIGENTILISNTDGQINVKGLDAGNYKLEETAAPSGYNKLKEPIDVTIESTENAAEFKRTSAVRYGKDNITAGDEGVRVENKTGATLPSTGGIGTTVFYVLGSVLALGAGILLVTKKRMAAE